MRKKLKNMDLQTLRVLAELFKTGSLTRTADRMDLSQPAVSMVLSKLRSHFNDKLFVRVGNEMRPTRQAEELHDHISTAISALEAALAFRSDFDPAETERNFRIAMSDIGQVVMAPGLLRTFSNQAPHASLEICSIGETTPHLLQTGNIDLVAGFARQMPGAFLQRTLYDESYVILARTGHPRINKKLSVEQFKTEFHVAVMSTSATHLVIDKGLEELHLRRKIAVKVPNFMIVAKLISQTDYLCILPRRAGIALAADGSIKAYKPPFDLQSYQAKLYWHERQTSDGGNKWLRDCLLSLFTDE